MDLSFIQSNLQAILDNGQTIVTCFLALVVAITHFLAIFKLPATNPVVKAHNLVAGNYGNSAPILPPSNPANNP